MGDHYDGYAEADEAIRDKRMAKREREMLAREGHYVFLAERRRSQVCKACGEPVASDGYSWHHIKGIPTQAEVIALEGHLVERANNPNFCHTCRAKIDFAPSENRYYHCSAPDAPWGDREGEHKHLR